MLVVRAVEDQPVRGIKKGDEFRLYIVDAHHHMGREKGHQNTPAGAYEFYAQLWFEMQKKTQSLIDEDNLLFEPVRVEASHLVSKLFQSKSNWSRLDHGWLVDRTIVFPYTDDYSAPPVSLCKLTGTKAVLSWRDPRDGNLMVSEIDFIG